MSDSTPLSFTILGTGALGGFYGSRLLLGGATVRFIAHSDVDWIRAHGLRVDSPLGDHLFHPVEVYASSDLIPPSAVVCIGLKTTLNDRLPELLAPLVGAGTVILNWQNGLTLEEELAACFPQAVVIAGLCFLCSNKVGPGHIVHLDYGRISLAARDEPGLVWLPRLQAAFGAGGIETDVQPSLPAARWRKLAWNIPFNGLSVLLDRNTDAIMADPEARALAERLMHEVAAGAAACGVPFAPDFIPQLLAATERMAPYAPSMRLDFLAKRPLEVEYLYRRPLREAARHGVRMPGVETIAAQLSLLDRANRGDSASGAE
ncbi:2-dehydropantoate 2-reductase [Thermochromatium tepidum]|jgi:2-dehydropantoate 2-reductase|uniref:2-dehydropantoate 2-reductase n=1 Tax=Thermochromatium tepidum ATCC 43061 TaxID=316276 RepID=A0A6I6EB06_THETI|nr:2-dehydropantoate 2-reductase [Thermochromatium tepidum]QGU32119.1 2-dehydropantoate 2-reductase [Thermochromatium tepidum ATCC 43061]